MAAQGSWVRATANHSPSEDQLLARDGLLAPKHERTDHEQNYHEQNSQHGRERGRLPGSTSANATVVIQSGRRSLLGSRSGPPSALGMQALDGSSA
jgi:hypothetical protein